jgi:hypothetical protein
MLMVVQCWWLTAIILTTWEAATGKIVVGSKPRQKVREIPSQPLKKAEDFNYHSKSHYARYILAFLITTLIFNKTS